MYRIEKHPVVDIVERKKIPFYFEGQKLYALEGEVISSALIANGIKIFSYHKKDNFPQGIYCANGQCAQCSVIADNKVVKACVTRVKEGMKVERLRGVGKIDISVKDKPEFNRVEEIETDVLIVGGGPSGLASAVELGKFNLDILLIDDKDKLGGKLVLQTHKFFGSVDDCYAGTRGIDIAEKLAEDLEKYPSIKVWTSSNCVAVFADKKIGVVKDDVYYLITPKAVIFATGAREKTLLFEGNTLPGVYGAGAFQTLVNRDLVKASEKLFVVGGGNVGLIAAYHALQAGIDVVGLCEIADRCGGYKVHEDKIKRLGVPVFTRHTILRAEGKESVERVIIAEVDKDFKPVRGSEKTFEVDTVLIASGLSPINELHIQAKKFGMASFICGDAKEIAEASAAMFSGKITAHEVLKYLGFVTNDVPGFWYEKLEILKSRPGKVYDRKTGKIEKKVYPVIHCRQEIPCNPCVTVCPKKSIKLTGPTIMSLPEFDGECIGCFRCLVICPGLAITIVDKRKDNVVWIPLELNLSIKKGDRVLAVDSDGNTVDECEIYDIKHFNAENTTAVALKTSEENLEKISSVKIYSYQDFKKYHGDYKNLSDDAVVCRCERVTLGEIRKYIREGVRDLNQLKAITRVGMGACGSKTCGMFLMNIMKAEGVDLKEVVELTKRPLFMEVEFKAFLGSKKEDEVADSFSNF